jgi:hypothetical protein
VVTYREHMNRSSVGRLVGNWSYDLRSVTEVAIMVVDPLGQVVEPALGVR